MQFQCRPCVQFLRRFGLYEHNDVRMSPDVPNDGVCHLTLSEFTRLISTG